MIMGCGTDAPVIEEPEAGYAHVELGIVPDPAIALKNTRLIATVTDRVGMPLSGLAVTFDLTMPGMYHGDNRPVADEILPGVYEAGAVLTMGGRWLVVVEVRGEGLYVKEEFYTDAKSK
jgi:hypothetical protein